MKQYNAESAAAIFGVSPERIKQQYAANAKTLRECEATARNTGKIYRGKTADQWAQYALKYENLSK